MRERSITTKSADVEYILKIQFKNLKFFQKDWKQRIETKMWNPKYRNKNGKIAKHRKKRTPVYKNSISQPEVIAADPLVVKLIPRPLAERRSSTTH